MAEDPGGRIVMLNLLRFKDDGRASYERYAEEIRPHLDAGGGRVLYGGECGEPLVAPEAHRWDAILLVEYPSRARFSEMVANPDYQRITHLRTEALADAVLQPTAPWSVG